MNENILVIEHRAELLEKIVDILKERHYNPISKQSPVLKPSVYLMKHRLI